MSASSDSPEEPLPSGESKHEAPKRVIFEGFTGESAVITDRLRLLFDDFMRDNLLGFDMASIAAHLLEIQNVAGQKDVPYMERQSLLRAREQMLERLRLRGSPSLLAELEHVLQLRTEELVQFLKDDRPGTLPFPSVNAEALTMLLSYASMCWNVGGQIARSLKESGDEMQDDA